MDILNNWTVSNNLVVETYFVNNKLSLNLDTKLILLHSFIHNHHLNN